MIKKILKRVFGITEMEEAIAETIKRKEEAELLAKKAEEEHLRISQENAEAQRLAQLSPKELATEKKEPYIAVLNTHVNPENVRNGFFELDWNEYFVLDLRNNGYQGETEEEVVDQWFQELCRNVGAEANINMERRGSGFVNRALREDGKAEFF